MAFVVTVFSGLGHFRIRAGGILEVVPIQDRKTALSSKCSFESPGSGWEKESRHFGPTCDLGTSAALLRT